MMIGRGGVVLISYFGVTAGLGRAKDEPTCCPSFALCASCPLSYLVLPTPLGPFVATSHGDGRMERDKTVGTGELGQRDRRLVLRICN